MHPILSRSFWAHAESFRPRGPFLIALPLGVLLAALVYFLCRSRGYFADEGSYCTIAQGILLGKLPYRSYFNEKPPLQYFWTAGVMAISHPTIYGARLASAIALALSAACILRGPVSRNAGLPALLGWSVLIFLAAMDLSAFNDTTETSLAFLFSASAVLTAREDMDERKLGFVAVLQGAIFGIAIGFRQTAIVPALVMLFLPSARLPRRSYCCGLALGVLGWLVPVIALGIGREFFESAVFFHINNPSAGTYFRGLDTNGRWGFALWFLCLVWLAFLKEYRPNRLWLILWCVAMAIPYFGRMDTFRLWPSLAAMLVLIARPHLENAPMARGAAIAMALVACGALLIGFPKRSSSIIEISRLVALVTRPDDRIWVSPFNPLPYCLAQRQPASRYYFILPWTAKTEVRREIMANIAATSPKLIVLDDERHGDFSARSLLPELNAAIVSHYHFRGARDGTAFYQRNVRTRSAAQAKAASAD